VDTDDAHGAQRPGEMRRHEEADHSGDVKRRLEAQADAVFQRTDVVRVVPLEARYLLAVQAPWRALQLTPPCARLGALATPCYGSMSGPDIGAAPPAWPVASDALPSMSDELGASLGGFVSIDVMRARHLTIGPELSWLTPESPREDLLRLRILASGWGVRYTWSETGISAGVGVCTRFVKMGEVDLPVVDMLTTEARIELVLP
jgi:hypothetical protein